MSYLKLAKLAMLIVSVHYELLNVYVLSISGYVIEC